MYCDVSNNKQYIVRKIGNKYCRRNIVARNMFNMQYKLVFACSYSQHMQTVPSAAVQLLHKGKVIPLQAQRVDGGTAVLFNDRGTRRGWVVSSTPWPHFTPGKEPVPIVQEGGWALGPVWTGEKSRHHRHSIPDRRTRSQSLYRLSYPTHAALT